MAVFLGFGLTPVERTRGLASTSDRVKEVTGRDARVRCWHQVRRDERAHLSKRTLTVIVPSFSKMAYRMLAIDVCPSRRNASTSSECVTFSSAIASLLTWPFRNFWHAFAIQNYLAPD